MNRRIKIYIVLVLGISLLFSISTLGCAKTGEEAIKNVIGSLIEAENEANESQQENIPAVNSADSGGSGSTSDDDSAGSSGADNAQINTSQSGAVSWPSEIPGNVPRLPGDIAQVIVTHPEQGWSNYTIAFVNINNINIDDYAAELEANGWSIDMKSDMGDAWIIYAGYGEDIILTAGIESTDNSGMLNLTIPK